MNQEAEKVMNELQDEFLKIITDVRMHLEYQKALGINTIEALSAAPDRSAVVPSKTNTTAIPSPTMDKPETPQSAGLADVREELGNCTRCKLHESRTTIVFGEGDGNAVVVFVGEGPGYDEDQQGRPFVGAAGQLLTDIIVKGMKLKREDVYICNIVKCRPPNNRNPEPDEIEMCEPFLAKQLHAIQPKVIVALGNIAAKTLLKTDERITSLRGQWRTYRGIPLMPTFHPAYLLRNPKDKALVWKDIQQVMVKLGLTVTK